MEDEKKIQKTKEVYDAVCKYLEAHNWPYHKTEEKFMIDCKAAGEDLPMDITIHLNPNVQILSIFSCLPFEIPEDKRLDFAVAVSVINNKLLNGCFDYDIHSGHVYYRMTNSFMESTLGDDAFTYLLFASCKIIDDYNDKLLMLAKNLISLEQFISNNQ